MRIAYEATALLGDRTGVGEFCFGALEALSKFETFDIHAFAISYRRRNQLRTLLPKNISFSDWIMPARPLHFLWERSAFPPIEVWDRKIDLVHGTNFIVPPTYRSAKVVTIHDLTTVRFPDMCDKPTLIYPHLIKRALDNGAFVHTPSEFVATEVIEYFQVDPSRVKAVHHGIPRISTDNKSIEIKVPELEGKRFVLALGTVEPRKDLPMLVAAFEMIAQSDVNLHLVIAGRDGWGSDSLREAIERSKVNSRILRLGYVDTGLRSWLLQNATVFAYPSIYEGFGFPPLEAMSIGTPVISTNAGALGEILSGDVSVLIQPGDTVGLAEGIRSIVEDKDFSVRLSSLGKTYVERFSWEKCAAGLGELYRVACQE